MSNPNVKNENKKYTILDRVVDVEPSGVIYTIKGSTVEEFVEEYLSRKGVDGVSEVKVHVRSEGRNRPDIALYLFMDQNSKYITSQMSNVPPMLRNKVDTKVNMSLSDNFRQILYPLCGNNIQSGKAENREYYVKLDIFRAVGMMFAVNASRHALVISDVKSIPGGRDCVISVIKNETFSGFSSGNADNYSRQIDYIEKNRH